MLLDIYLNNGVIFFIKSKVVLIFKLCAFKNHHHQLPVPYFIYADFESIQIPKSGLKAEKTEIIDEH